MRQPESVSEVTQAAEREHAMPFTTSLVWMLPTLDGGAVVLWEIAVRDGGEDSGSIKESLLRALRSPGSTIPVCRSATTRGSGCTGIMGAGIVAIVAETSQGIPHFLEKS